MGKDSLLKSTIPKKSKSKTARKTTAKTRSKKQAARPKNQGARKPAVKQKDLIFKKFDWQMPPKASIDRRAPQSDTVSCPSAIETTVMDEAWRELIFRRFSPADIQAAAKSPGILQAGSASVRSAPSQSQTCGDTDVSPFPGYPVRSDPVIRSMLYGIAALALMVMLIVGASARNHSRYFLVARNDAVEIWRGRFSPTGNEFYSILHNYRLMEPSKPFYSKQEIFPIMFHYYLQKADDVLDLQNLPDFLTINNYLNTASQFALTDQMHQAVLMRMNAIEQLIFLYKADVAINRGTPHSLELAIQYLNDAKGLTRGSAQRQVIEERLTLVRTQLKALTEETSDGQ